MNKMLTDSHFHSSIENTTSNVQCCENKILRYISVCYMVWAQYVFGCKMEEIYLMVFKLKKNIVPFNLVHIRT